MRVLATACLAVAAATASAHEPPLCASNRSLIEASLKDIAIERAYLLTEDIEAIGGRPANHSSKAIYIASAWGQINASLQHMQALGCEPFSEPIDPAYYSAAVDACERDKSRDRRACRRKDWQRAAPAMN